MSESGSHPEKADVTPLSDDERAVLAESVRVGTTSGSGLADSLGIGHGCGWQVVERLLRHRWLEVTDAHWRHVRVTEAGRAMLDPPNPRD